MEQKKGCPRSNESGQPAVRKKERASTRDLNSVKRSYYQVKRTPICWLRIGRETSLICPGKDVHATLALQFVTSPPGFDRLALFSALKTSQRNWSFMFSLIWKFLSNAQSAVNNPGPRSELRLAFPNVKAAGFEYAVGLNQQFTVWTGIVPPLGLRQAPLEGLPVLLGRSPISKLLKEPASMPGENARPLSAVVIPVHSHPPMKAFRTEPTSDAKRCPRPNGNSRVWPSVKTLARSKTAGP